MAQPETHSLPWIDVDPDYAGRTGYDPGFLGMGLDVALPRADGRRLMPTVLTPTLRYHHFSLRLHKHRRLASFTAVNMEGAAAYPRTGRGDDSWQLDPRAPDSQTQQPEFRRPFQRGHLVMRLDPLWGDTRMAELAEADTFHWSNCAPMHSRLNGTWWHSVERHVLETADVTERRLCVFAGPVLHPRDPVLRGVRVPLAYWKVLAWRPRGALGVRSMGFVVRQDAEVRDALEPAEQTAGVRTALDFPDTPTKVRAYQATVGMVQALTGLHFGPLATEAADVYARLPQEVMERQLAPGLRPLRKVEDLFVAS
jgi:endonuclease G, mitochondrial